MSGKIAQRWVIGDEIWTGSKPTRSGDSGGDQCFCWDVGKRAALTANIQQKRSRVLSGFLAAADLRITEPWQIFREDRAIIVAFVFYLLAMGSSPVQNPWWVKSSGREMGIDSMSQPKRFQDTHDSDLPAELVELGELLESAGVDDESKETLIKSYNRVAESVLRRRRILNLVQEALSQLRLDVKYLMFDLEMTRRERDELQERIEGEDRGF